MTLISTLKRIVIGSLFLFVFAAKNSFAQTLPFPTTRVYDEISPWGYTDRGTNWDTSPYISFIYKDVWFRIMPPNGVDYDISTDVWTFNEPGKKYPAAYFQHGAGKSGTDNNIQLANGGIQYRNAVLSGEFDGFVVYPQSLSRGAQSPDENAGVINELLELLPIDRFKIHLFGTSNGAKSTWNFALAYPTIPASISAFSGVPDSYAISEHNNLLYTAKRQYQGGRDTNPTPSGSQALADIYTSRGAPFQYNYYENVGHASWDVSGLGFNAPDYFSWQLDQSINNLQVLYDNREICPGDPINVTLGVPPNLNDYEWQKDGILITGENSHTLNVNEFGSYSVRVNIDGEWSEWSIEVISERQPTQTPPITTNGNLSVYVPSPDGNALTSLVLPDGFVEYSWEDVNTSLEVADANVFDQVGPGVYRATVREEGGCSSLYSANFEVIDADGIDKPDIPGGLSTNIVSKTEVEVLWSQNPTPAFNEIGFEIYRSTVVDSEYELISIVNTDEGSYLDQNLESGTLYYYKVRAIGASSASVATEAVEGLTEVDEESPSTPLNFRSTEISPNSISLAWDEATDNIGISVYNVFVNGVKSYITPNNTFTVFGLTDQTVYNFKIQAEDLAGNLSPFSGQVTEAAINNGLNYSYYHGTWSVLPDFSALTPIEEGRVDNIDISDRQQNNNFGFVFTGNIRIPAEGSYTFYLSSDDGSKLWIDGNLIVDYDGTHGAGEVNGAVTLTTGIHSFKVDYFERTGNSEILDVSWEGPNIAKELIPSSAFNDDFTWPGVAPANLDLSTVVATSYDAISLTWLDSNDETGYQIYRSTNENGPFIPIALLPENTTNYDDSGLTPGTIYYYQILALGTYGQSQLSIPVDPLSILRLDGSLSDELSLITVLNRNNTSFDNQIVKKGTHSAYFPANNDYLDIDTGNEFIHGLLAERSISFWVRTPNVSGIQDVFDEGGSTNGLGLRINNGTIEFATQDNHNIQTIEAPIIADEWTHIVGVFDNGNLRLYINGVLEASKDDIGYVVVNAHSNGGGLGASNSSNAFDQVNNNFHGWIDDFSIYSVALDASNIEAMERVNKSATTLDLPILPLSPDNLVGVSTSVSSIDLTWNDNSDNEVGFDLYKSEGDESDYRLLAELGADVTTYEDGGLFAHTTYYYQLRSKNAGGESAFSNSGAVTTLNSAPIPTVSLSDISMHYDQEIVLDLLATDAEGDLIIINPIDLPSFVLFFDNGDGTAGMVIDPTSTDAGTYTNIGVSYSDIYGGLHEERFTLSVLNNYPPSIAEVSTLSLYEGETDSRSITVADVDDATITWTLSGLPAFASYSIDTNNTLTIDVAPGLEDSGDYPVSLIATDASNNQDSTGLVISILDFDPNYKVYVNLGNSSPAGLPWNNFMSDGVSGAAISNLVNENGAQSGISLSLTSTWSGSQLSGGMTSTIYPTEVSKSYLWTDNGPETILVSGLTSGNLYSFEFFGSRNSSGDRRSIYSIGSLTDTLEASFNTTASVLFEAQLADENGEILITVDNVKGGAFSVAYLNAIVIDVIEDSGDVPSAPTDLVGVFNVTTGAVDLNWTDASGDETSFEIYRSVGDNTSYSLLNSTAMDVALYSDSDISSNATHYYKVEAVNFRGSSLSSNEVAVDFPNLAPVISGLTASNILVGTNATIDFTVTDPESDAITVAIAGLPSFGSYTYANGIGQIALSPGINDLGDYTITVTATDAHANISDEDFVLSVAERVTEYVYVNFSTGGGGPSSWNNLVGNPSPGYGLSDLKNGEGASTGYSLSLTEGWPGGNNQGVITGDDSGVYPDDVMSTYYADNSLTERHIVLSGLSTDKVYDLAFFSSRSGVTDARTTNYSVAGKTTTLDATNNSTETALITSVTADAQGEIIITVQKSSTSAWGYINALELRYYDAPVLPGIPLNVVAQSLSKTSVNLDWQDNSSNEDGFEVYRSTSSGSGYSLVATLGTDVETYTDESLAENSTYYYQLRSYNASGTSLYTDAVAVSTYNSIVLLNFGDENNLAPSPWNNTGNYPFIGNEYPDLKNDQGLNTGMSMSIVNNTDGTTFEAAGSLGSITGDDSGVYLDAVMTSYYWMILGVKTSIKYSNLNLANQYDFVFFASRSATGRGTTFTINGESVSLDAAFNTTETVRLNGILPDANGEIVIDMISSSGATVGYINAMEVRSSNVASTPSSASLASIQKVVNTASRESEEGSNENINYELSVYPNPFTDMVNVSLQLESSQEVKVTVVDQTGRIVRDLSQTVGEGHHILNVSLPDLQPGLYLLRVVTEAGQIDLQRIMKK